MPGRLAAQLEPRATLDQVPVSPLGPNGYPYAGEVREEQHNVRAMSIAVGQRLTLCGLRRAWRNIGFMVDPGNLAGEGNTILAQLRIRTAGGREALSAQTWTINPGAPVFYFGLQVGARCELVVTGVSSDPIKTVNGAIWGMNED
jgi:hypothetical protein